MKRLRQSFNHVERLQGFFEDRQVNIEQFKSSLPHDQRVELQDTLRIIVAYDKCELRDVSIQLELYSEWISYLFKNRQGTALACPSASTGSPETLSGLVLKSQLWCALDRLLGRQVMQFLICDACLFLPQQHLVDTYVQISGTPLKLERSRQPLKHKPRLSGIYITKSKPLQKFEKDQIAKGLYKKPESIDIDTIVNLQFVLPLEFKNRFPPIRPNGIVEYKEPPLEDMTADLYVLDSHLMTVKEGLQSGNLQKKYKNIYIKRTDIVPKQAVARFCISCLRFLLPQDTFGSRENWKLLESKVLQYVKINGHSKFFLTNMISGFKVTETWMGRATSKQQATRNQRIFSQFVYWVFTLLNEFILSFFSQRSCGVGGGGDIYLKSSGWRVAQNMKLEEFAGKLTPINSEDGYQCATASVAHVIPKNRPGAFRVLVNLSHYKTLLASANQVLKFHADRAYEIPNMKSINEAYPLVRQFMENHQGAKFYAVRTDIQGCFDEANSAMVQSIVERLTSGSCYAYRSLQPRCTVRGKIAESVTELKKDTNMLETHDIPHHVVHQIYNEVNLKTRLVDGKSVLQRVNRFLKHLVVKAGDEFYLKNTGIPQGLSISTSLCNLLCQEFIRTELARFWTSSDVLLLRYVDDFLFITSKEAEARMFLRTINRPESFPRYGISFSPQKTEANFGPNSVDQTTFLGIPISWRGNKIHMVPSLGLGSLIDAVRSTYKHKDVTLVYGGRVTRQLMPIQLDVFPADLSPYLRTHKWVYGGPAWIDIESVIDLKTSKLAAVFKAFAACKHVPPLEFILKVVRGAVMSICQLLLLLDVSFLTSRKIISRFLNKLIRSCGIRKKGVVKYGIGVWINVYKRKKLSA